MNAKNEKLPNCVEISERFRSSEDYFLFCDTILKAGFGVAQWKSKCVAKKMSSFIKPAFEAFVLLAYENCYEAYKDGGQVMDPSKKFKYTADKKFSARNRGWPDEAIVRYNELHAKMLLYWQNNSAFDDELLEALAEKYMKKKKKRNQEQEAPVRLASNDLGEGIDWTEI